MSGERHEQDRRRYDDLKEAYVLGALAEEERRWFDEYLAAHPELQAEVDDLGATANLLALAPQEHEPPDEIRRSLLASIGGTPEVAEDRPRRTGLRGLPASLGVAAAAVIAVAGLLVWNVALSEENEGLRGELEERQTYELEGSGAASDVRGEVVRVGDGRAVLMAENMPPAPEGQVYEAWLMSDGVPEPAGLFQPVGSGTVAVAIEGTLEGADTVAVTAEPSGGSPAPTGEILLTATL